MWVAPLQSAPGLAIPVIENMREWDRREIFATRANDDNDEFFADVMCTGERAWVAGAVHWEPIAVFGAAPMWPGVWSMWFFATNNLNKIGLSVTKLIIQDIVPSLQAAGAHRLECRSMEGHIDAQRWLGTLGATKEGELRGYGRSGETFYVFTWQRVLDAWRKR